jgi:ubiquinone/menaquinone biosynthesis C-methylase UbiE
VTRSRAWTRACSRPPLADKLTPEQIRAYWTEQARSHGLSPAASWSDTAVIDLEIRELLSRLDDGDRVLDVGCANGYSTIRYAAEKAIAIRGVDYVPEMIEQARARAASLRGRLAGTVEFDVADATALPEHEAPYDKVLSVRVLINLGSWAAQQVALAGLARMTRPGGLLLLSEATEQGWTKLNAFRGEWGLSPIPVPEFNTYLDEERVVEALSPSFDLVEIVNFASTYYVGTRVLKPLLIQALDANVDVADPDLHWNQWWAMAPAWGDYGTQKLFVFRKRARSIG